jgi:alkyl hydroperoxide reductase subunit AhpC
MQVNDLPVGRSVDEVLRLLLAFQFVEKHGEGEVTCTCRAYATICAVCPANWQPNSPTINPAKAGDYFQKVNK